eukprot:jgi/Botrbrau1/15644/Bobra.4_1s0028.1
MACVRWDPWDPYGVGDPRAQRLNLLEAMPLQKAFESACGRARSCTEKNRKEGWLRKASLSRSIHLLCTRVATCV